MAELARCPCGSVPTYLIFDAEHDTPKWARCAGACCYEWWLEYRNNYHELNSAESVELATKAWNEAPRGNQ